jgi:hypothetical protein
MLCSWANCVSICVRMARMHMFFFIENLYVFDVTKINNTTVCVTAVLNASKIFVWCHWQWVILNFSKLWINLSGFECEQPDIDWLKHFAPGRETTRISLPFSSSIEAIQCPLFKASSFPATLVGVPPRVTCLLGSSVASNHAKTFQSS